MVRELLVGELLSNSSTLASYRTEYEVDPEGLVILGQYCEGNPGGVRAARPGEATSYREWDAQVILEPRHGARVGADGMEGFPWPGLAPRPCSYYRCSIYLALPLFICLFISF